MRKYISVVLGTVLSASVAVHCSVAEDAPAGGAPTNITVMAFPSADYLGTYTAIEKGLFSKRGLIVQHQTATSGPGTIASVMSGTVQFAATATTSMISAAVNNVPVLMVATAASGQLSGPDAVAYLARPEAGIKSPKDLVGKKVAVPGLGAYLDLVGKMAILKDGADPTKALFVELPLPNVLTALKRGDIDAALAPEPFLTRFKDGGMVVFDFPNRAVDPTLQYDGFFTSVKYANEHPAVVDSFVAAVKEGQNYAQDPKNRQEMLQILSKYTNTPVADLSKVMMPLFEPELSRTSIKAMADAMVTLKFIDKVPDLEKVFRFPK